MATQQKRLKTKSEKKRNAQQALEIGKRLRARRLELPGTGPNGQMTQRELGLRLKTRTGRPVSESTISSWERGEEAPEPIRRQAIADALQTTMGDIFGEPQDANLIKRLRDIEAEVAAIKFLGGFDEAVDAVLRRQRQEDRDSNHRDVLEQIAEDAPTQTAVPDEADGNEPAPHVAHRPK
jgi:transcriptional regulator with XRE-family HTH domain